MEQLKLHGATVDLYDHSDEMPIELYNHANMYAMRDAQVGSSMEDVVRHHERLHFFIAQKDFDSILQTSKNLHQCYFNILQRNNFKGLGFACYIKSINGREIYDYGFDALKSRLVDLSRAGLTMGHVKEAGPVLKKKFWPSFVRHFLKSLRTQARLPIDSTTATESSPSSIT